MPFRFSLAAVLRVRESIEEREERALRKIQLKISRTARQIEELDVEISGLHSEREQEMKLPIQAARLRLFLGRLEVSIEKRKALCTQLETLKQDRDQQMAVYRSAHRNRETLTEMSSKLKDVYELEQDRVDQNTVDEIFIMRRPRG